MKFFNINPVRPLLGLDLGAACIKAVQLKKEKNRFYLERYGILSTTPGAIKESWVERPADLSENIRDLLCRAGIKHRRVNLALGGQHVVLRHITLPPLSKKELPEAVRWEAEKYIMIPIKDVIVDFRYLGEEDNKKNRVINVALVAVPREVVSSYLEAVTKAGLHPTAVEIGPFALERAFQATGDYIKQKNSYPDANSSAKNAGPPSTSVSLSKAALLLDIGYETTDLLVLEEGEYRFARTIDIGILKFQATVKDYLSTDDLTARHHLMDADTWNNPQILTLARQLLENIRRSLEYYLDKISLWEVGMNKMYITGGGGTLTYLIDFLARELFLEPRLFDPLGQLTAGAAHPDKFNTSLLGLSVGLALRGEVK